MTGQRAANDDDSVDPAFPRLAVAYDMTSSSPLDLVELIGGQCQIIWIVEAADPGLGKWARLLPRLGQVVDRAGRSPTAVAELLRDMHVEGAIAFTDTQLRLAATISQALGLPGNPPDAIDALLDKVTQRNKLAEGGVQVPRFVRLAGGAGRDEVTELAHVGFPMVVKPAHGSSSRDVFPISDREHLKSCLDTIMGGAPALSEDYLAEAWLIDSESRAMPFLGSYVSVEAMAQEGVINPLAITGKFPTAAPCRETGNFMPHHLAPDEAARVRALSIKAAEALGVRSGALHIEIKLTPVGPQVIEVNGRVGGGGIDQLYASTHGQSLTHIATQIALGQAVEWAAGSDPGGGPIEYDYYVQPPVGASRFAGIENLDAVLALAGVKGARVNLTIGDTVDWREGSQGYVLSVRGTVPNHAALADVGPRIMNAVVLTFDQGSGAA